MISTVEIKGFDEFDKYTKSINDDETPVLFYFSGEKLPDGNSWCPDCVVGKFCFYNKGFYRTPSLSKSYRVNVLPT